MSNNNASKCFEANMKTHEEFCSTHELTINLTKIYIKDIFLTYGLNLV